MSSKIEIHRGEDILSLSVPESHEINTLSDRLTLIEEDIKKLWASVGPGEGETDNPDEDVIDRLEPGDSYWESSYDGQILSLAPGVHKRQFYVRNNNVSIIGLADENGIYPTVDGRVSNEDLGLTWSDMNDGLWSAVLPELPGIWHFEDGHPDGRAKNHNAVHPILCSIEDEILEYTTLEPKDLSEGQFSLSAPGGVAGLIYVKLRGDQSINNFMISNKPWLLEGDPNITGLTVKNIKFQYCSNTGKIGMVNSPGRDGYFENVSAKHANTIGFKFGSRESIHSKGNLLQPACNYTFKDVVANQNGQCGFWGKLKNSVVESFSNSYNGWKGGHPWWEVSHKIIESSNVKFLNGVCVGNAGAGFWLDIWNTDIEIDGLYLASNLFCGLLLEHGLHRLSAKDITIAGTKKFEGVSAGVILQSNIEDCEIEGIAVKDCEDGIRFNFADSRGDINNVTIAGYTYEDVDNPVRNIGSGDGSNIVAEG